MSGISHAVVWIDHRVAKIFAFDRDEAEQLTVGHSHAPHQVHHKAGTVGSGHIREDDSYLREIADALADLPEILIVGPSHSKWQLRAYLNLHAPLISQRVVAVLHADHPSDRQIVAHARKYFLRIARMLPQKAKRYG